MNSFLDMAPAAARVVVVGDARYPVPGIKAKGVAYLAKRYWDTFAPLVAKARESAAAVKAGGAATFGNDEIINAILGLDDDVIAAVIAAGMGHAGSERAEAIASGLSFASQTKFILAIFEETMPDGAVPFVEDVAKLFVAIAREKAAALANEAGQASSKPSRKRSIT